MFLQRTLAVIPPIPPINPTANVITSLPITSVGFICAQVSKDSIKPPEKADTSSVLYSKVVIKVKNLGIIVKLELFW